MREIVYDAYHTLVRKNEYGDKFIDRELGVHDGDNDNESGL